jgi:hypothetical protein
MSRSGRARTSALVRLLVATGLVAGGLVTASIGPAGATGRWSVVPSVSPTGPPLGDLAAVSCSSASDCFAVGAGLFEHWNGSSWSIVPGASAGFGAELFGVSCTSPTSCFAVGDIATETETSFTSKSLIERWDGSTWSIVPSPVLSGATAVFLSGVSCTSPTSCFAVGASSDSPATFDQFVGAPLVERWDGSTWSVVPSPGPSDALEAELLGVSCVSASSCYAVGDFQAPAIGGALLEHWDGASWSVVPNPDSGFARKSGSGRRLPVGFERARSSKPQQIGDVSSSPGLQGVSCSSDANCFAVGNSFTGALVERWNGTAWSNVTTPTPRNSLGADLGSVACTSSTDCSAVGIQGAVETSGDIIDISDAPLQEHWDGSAWTVLPGPSGAPFSELSGVACGSPTACFAVGDSAFVQLWNGTKWSLAPFGSPTSQSQLNQVACTSTTSCFAVGSFESNVQSDTLIEHWNGTSWAKVPSPTPSGSFDALLIGVACAGPTSCFAVGSYGAANGLRTLIERWNGSSWKVSSSPTPQGAEVAQLTGVACPSANNCNAVGLGLSLTGAKALVEHWNGRAWSIAATPGLSGALFVELAGITCPGVTDCTAVGTFESLQGTRSPGAQVLVEHWDGTTWSVVPSPNPAGAPFATLIDVSCPSASSCLAVGYDAKSSEGALHVLSERWNGKTWAVVNVPVPRGSTNGELLAVSCRSASSCYAVGDTTTKTLIEHWNGTAWSIVASPVPGGTTRVELSGVSCPSSTTCMAVGRYSARDSIFTLAEIGP